MVADIQQPASCWLADHLLNFSAHIKDGDDPSCIFKYAGVEIEIRLLSCPGVYDRDIIENKISNTPIGKPK